MVYWLAASIIVNVLLVFGGYILWCALWRATDKRIDAESRFYHSFGTRAWHITLENADDYVQPYSLRVTAAFARDNGRITRLAISDLALLDVAKKEFERIHPERFAVTDRAESQAFVEDDAQPALSP